MHGQNLSDWNSHLDVAKLQSQAQMAQAQNQIQQARDYANAQMTKEASTVLTQVEMGAKANQTLALTLMSTPAAEVGVGLYAFSDGLAKGAGFANGLINNNYAKIFTTAESWLAGGIGQKLFVYGTGVTSSANFGDAFGSTAFDLTNP
jgi:hypothetical protein